MNSAAAPALSSKSDLDTAFAHTQWDETAEMAYEILKKDPGYGPAKIKGAYALFQRGYTNAALLFLRRLSPAEWHSLREGQDRFVEIVSLFQKKVPVDVLPGRLEDANLERVSPFLQDEIRYAKGRDALSRGDLARAKDFLGSVRRSSRFYSQARYTLASIAIRAHDYDTAGAELSHIFEPTVLSQTSEFWKDMSTQATSHWGAGVQVLLDPEPLLTEKKVGELGLLGFARIAYAKHNFDTALDFYDKFSPTSDYFARANLEKIWALLALNKNDAAAQAAAQLSHDESHFESVEARTIRALILVDSEKTDEARDELKRFFSVYDKAKEGLERYAKYRTTDELPAFLKEDLKEEVRLKSHEVYQTSVKDEIARLNKEDPKLFPVYSRLALELDPLLSLSRNETTKVTASRVGKRLADLDRLALQAKLIMAESYLEDREKLRAEFRALKNPSEAKQHEHDQRLVKLLGQAVNEVDEAMAFKRDRQPNLEFRQAELLWELATARNILAVSTEDRNAQEAAADKLKARALKTAESVVASFPHFIKRADALFFVGFAEIELGQDAKGLSTLEWYLREYPTHFHAPDALRIIADAKFDRNDFAGAQSYYRRILKFSDSPIIGYSLYKIGWCAYNEKNFSQALLGLEKAITWARQGEADLSLNLTRESKHDLISIYAEVGDYKKAFGYFKTVFGDEAPKMLAALAEELDNTGQFEKATELHKDLIRLNPGAKENLAYQTAIVKDAYKLRRWDSVMKETGELTDRYRSELKNPEPQGGLAYLAEQVMRETALAQHFEFKKTATKEDTERIIKLDRAYLAAFEKWPSSQEVQYVLASYLLDNNRVADAADAFKTHWDRYNGSLREPLKEEALRNLLYTLDKVESKKKAEKEISDPANEILTYSSLYSRLYPATKYSRPIAGLRAAVLFKYDRIDQGMVESQKILDEKASDEPGREAFKNLRLAYYKKKDWKATNAWAAKMAERQDMAPYRKDLTTMRGETAFLIADAEPDNVKAAAEYETIANDSEMSWLRDKALYNAFVRLDKAGKKAEAVEISAKLARTSPKFEGLTQAAGIRAALYQEAGDYDKALPLLRDFLQRHDKDVTADTLQQARLNAALIAEAKEDYGSAMALFKAYVAASGKSGGKGKPEASGSPAGVDEAKRGIARIERRTRRSLAANVPGWDSALRSRAEFERMPIPKGKNLGERIKKGGTRLEALVKSFLAFSSNKDVPPSNAFEAYCSVPFLYQAYAEGIAQAGKGAPAEVTAELQKIATPIRAKAGELAGECLTRATEAEHDGPMFRRANERWGWESDPAMRRKASRLVAALEKGAPWLDPAPVKAGESEILKLHLSSTSTPDSWYTLAKLRYETKRPGLARLTVIDALTKSPDSGRLLNLLGLVEEGQPDPKGLSGIFEKAAKQGSRAAWVNLGLYHLKAGRLTAAIGPLRAALAAKTFDDKEELEKLVKEVTGP